MSHAYTAARAKVPDEHQPLYDALYELVKEGVGAPALDESIKWGQLMFHRGTENLIALIPLKARVNLQLFNGAHLSNPKGLMEGTGKDLRHVKCSSVELIETNRQSLLAMVADSVERGADVR